MEGAFKVTSRLLMVGLCLATAGSAAAQIREQDRRIEYMAVGVTTTF